MAVTKLSSVPFAEKTPLLITSVPHDPAKSDLSDQKGDPSFTPGTDDALTTDATDELKALRKKTVRELETLMSNELFGIGACGAVLASTFIHNGQRAAVKEFGANSRLGKKVAESDEFQDFCRRVSRQINDALNSDTYKTNVVDYTCLDARKGAISLPLITFQWSFSLRPLELRGSIGGVAGHEVFLRGFEFDSENDRFHADLTYHFYDHFGADDMDLIADKLLHGSTGQRALWLLAREHGPGHKPFIVKITLSGEASGLVAPVQAPVRP